MRFGRAAAGPSTSVLAIAIAIVIVSWMLASGAAAAGSAGSDRVEADARFRLPQSTSAVVLRYRERPSELAQAEFALVIEVFADGRIEVAEPRRSRRHGRYRAHLERGDLVALISGLVDDGVADFDAQRARDRRRALPRTQDRAQQVLVHDSDPEIIDLELHLAEYAPAPASGAAARRSDFANRFEMRGLRAQARRAPDDGELQALQRAVSRIRALALRGDLQKVD